MFVFDTDHLTILRRGCGAEFTNLYHRLMQFDDDAFFITIVSFQEELLGWNSYVAKSRSEEGAAAGYLKLAEVLTEFAQSQLLLYDEGAIEVFAELRKQRIRIGTMDLRIGAIALAHGMTVLTRNTRDFEKIPHLLIDDWTTRSE